jgi:hypothetical protein
VEYRVREESGSNPRWSRRPRAAAAQRAVRLGPSRRRQVAARREKSAEPTRSDLTVKHPAHEGLINQERHLDCES